MLRAVRGPLLILVLIALLLVGLWIWIRTSLPALQGSQTLPGLARAVDITRDEAGVPLIEAESQEDLYYALGFVHAQDRLWQMEHRRLQAAGRLAELLGEEALANDLLMRTLGLRLAAERDVANLSARASGVLQAYCDGVNAFLEHRSGALPLEFQLLGHTPSEWTPVDVALLQKLVSWEQTSGAADELFHARLAATISDDELVELLPGARPPLDSDTYAELSLAELHELLGGTSGWAKGSRAWAVAGEHTADGFPLLAFESVGQLTAPAPWYLVRLRAPGFLVAGATLPGLPLVFSGRNGLIAWALVPTPVDAQDLFVERLEENGNGARYRSGEGPREFDTRRELIAVRGDEDVSLSVRETVHGPVISDLVTDERDPEDFVVALRWTALVEADRTLQSLLDLAVAGDWGEFRVALRNLDEYHGTALYADVEGRIGWQRVGRAPEREAGQGAFPSAGWTGGPAWGGWVPFQRLERQLDPAAGIIAADGTGPATTDELLATLDAHTVESSTRLLGRERLSSTESLLPAIRSAVPATEVARRAHAQLLGWGGELDTRSAAPLVYSVWLPELVQELLGDELGARLAATLEEYPRLVARALAGNEWCDDHRTEGTEGCREVTSKAFADAVATLAEQYGPEIDEWPRLDRALLNYGHPVFEGTLLAPAFRVTPSGELIKAQELRRDVGPTYRAVYQLASGEAAGWGGSGFLIPTGQSGNPLSTYYRNLADRWQEVDLLPLLPAEPAEGDLLQLEPRR